MAKRFFYVCAGLLCLALVPACASIHAKDLRSVNLPPATMVAVGMISNDNVSDSTLAERIREAVYLALVEHRARYSVEIQDIAETDKGRGSADIVLQGGVGPYYRTGIAGGIEEFHGGGKPVPDRFSVGFRFQVGGRTVWSTTFWSGGHVSDSVEKLRRGVGARLASEFPYKK